MMLQDMLIQLPSRLSREPWQDSYLPPAGDPFWEGLPDDLSGRCRREGLRALESAWPALPASLYMDFHRTGNRNRFEDPYFRRRGLLQRMVLAYCAGERSPEMLDGIVNALTEICCEISWVVPAHNWPHQLLPPVSPDSVDLFAANTASLLALAVHLLREPLEALSLRIVRRVASLCRERCLIPYMEEDGHWWMGFRPVEGFGKPNNWNPWITANFLHALFLLPGCEDLAEAGTGRSVRILGNYLKGLSEDGGCDEGPSYWVHAAGSLYDCLDILESACAGSLPLKRDPWFRRAASYLERMHMGGEYFFNYADCPGRLPDLPKGLIRRMGEDTDNRALRDLADRLEAAGVCGEGDEDEREEAFSTFRLYRDLLRNTREKSAAETLREDSREEVREDSRPSRDLFPDLQIALFRGKVSGLNLAFKGGHNDESHNHNDIGSFILYGGGEALLADPGVGDYTRETFSEKRYSIWTMRSSWHNLPDINGCEQSPGSSFGCGRFTALEEGGELALEDAYPSEAGLKSWLRSFHLEDEAGRVVLEDRYRFHSSGGRCVWHFISLIKPLVREDLLVLSGKKGRLEIYPEFSAGGDVGIGSPSGSGSEKRDANGGQTDRAPYWEIRERTIPEGNHKLGLWGVDRLYRISLQVADLPREGKTRFSLNYFKNEPVNNSGNR